MYIAVDIETTGLYPHPGISKIFCVAVNTGKSIDVITDPLKLKPVLEDPSITKVIHNAGFDAFWLLRLHNIRVRNIWDTRLMEQIIIGENLPRNSNNEELKKELSSSLLYTLARYGLAELKDKHIGASFAGKPKDQALTAKEIEYAKNDVRYLLHLQAMQERRLMKLGLTRVANLENSLVETVVDMRARGIGFSEKIWNDIARKNEKIYNRLHKRLPATVENWNSPAQVKRYFNSIGIPVDSLTGIEEFKSAYNNDVLNQFIEMRKLYKSVTTYGRGWLQDEIKGTTVDTDGRVRADFEQMVNTGRFSCSHPNLQQLPPEQRQAFVPAPGNVFIIGDFSSQEIGIAAAASKEERWIKAILRGEDIHSLTASIVFPNEWRAGYEKGCVFPKKCKCKVHTAKREIAKITNFTILYGGGPTNIANKTKMSLKEATKIVYKFKKSVPKLTRWLETNAKNTVATRISYSADPFKRRRTLRDPEDWMLRNIGKNNPIQACGANMIKLSMVSLDRDRCPLVLTIHDELIIEVPKSKVKRALKEFKGVMEKAADYCTGVPGLIKVEPIISLNLQKK